MLVLTRKPGEALYVDEDRIKLTLLGIRGCQVKIGIDAPEHVSVHRDETWEKIINSLK